MEVSTGPHTAHTHPGWGRGRSWAGLTTWLSFTIPTGIQSQLKQQEDREKWVRAILGPCSQELANEDAGGGRSSLGHRPAWMLGSAAGMVVEAWKKSQALKGCWGLAPASCAQTPPHHQSASLQRNKGSDKMGQWLDCGM